MPHGYVANFGFAEQRFEKVNLTWGLDRRSPDGATDQETSWDLEPEIPDPREREDGVGWAIDLPVVLRMLELVARGAATADEARVTLVKITQLPSEKSGCCPDCDMAIDSYAKALVQHQENIGRFNDPYGYPYLVSTSTIHSWDCCQ